MTEIDRKDITPVLMALDTEFHRLQSKISNLVLDGEFESAHRYAKDMTAIIFAMNEFDRMAPRYPDTPEMPEMAALYILWSGQVASKIPAIKIIKDAFDFGLKDAKSLVDEAIHNNVFIGYMGKPEAIKVAGALHKEGFMAQVVLPGDGDAKWLSEEAITLEDIIKRRQPTTF